MSTDDDPRKEYKRRVLSQLRSVGYDPDILNAVESALDDEAVDNLFTKASATLSVSSPPIAGRIHEWYVGDAATAFAAREKKEGNVEVHGNVQGVISGGDVSGGSVSVIGSQATVSSYGRTILQELNKIGVDTVEAEDLLEKYDQASDQDKPALLNRLVSWLKKHAGELSSVGLAMLSVLAGLAKG